MELDHVLALERMLTEITPAPWEMGPNGYVIHRMFPVAMFYGDSAVLENTSASDKDVGKRAMQDMKFVVAVRTHLPAILEELRQLRAKVNG